MGTADLTNLDDLGLATALKAGMAATQIINFMNAESLIRQLQKNRA